MTLAGVLGTLGAVAAAIGILIGLDAWDRWWYKDDPLWGWIYQTRYPRRRPRRPGLNDGRDDAVS